MARKQRAARSDGPSIGGNATKTSGNARVMVITEFDAGDPEATLHALAEKYRRA
jgi:hypothetical protein